ncbi:LysR family transcriptional regulator [Novosphingobium sp.]|uniref:LysR family transcriptional regulator n=1 Tax=Novosphingobium sp. TaxID=1874826 RepID=UPI0031E4448C
MNSAREPSSLDWNHLRLFLAIARTGTLTAAAMRMKITQPTAGRQLRSLEEAAGTALFQRSHNGFRLTDAGQTVLAYAQNIEDEALQLERQLMNGEERLGGVLRLSTSDWFASRVLADPLAGFVDQHTGLTTELLADFRLSSLHRREADMVFRFAPFSEGDIVQRRFTHVRYGAYISPAYRRKFGDPLSSADGTGHHIVTMDTALAGAADALWLQQRWPQARLAFRSNNREAQAIACLRGTGIAVLPRLIGDSLGLERLEPAPPGRDVWLGYHRDVRHSRRIRLLIEHLTAHVQLEI